MMTELAMPMGEWINILLVEAEVSDDKDFADKVVHFVEEIVNPRIEALRNSNKKKRTELTEINRELELLVKENERLMGCKQRLKADCLLLKDKVNYLREQLVKNDRYIAKLEDEIVEYQREALKSGD